MAMFFLQQIIVLLPDTLESYRYQRLEVYVSHGVEETTGHTVKSQMRLQAIRNNLSHEKRAPGCLGLYITGSI